MGRGRFYIKWSYIIYPIGIYIMARVKDPSHFIFYYCKGSNSCGSSCSLSCASSCYYACANACITSCGQGCGPMSYCGGHCTQSGCGGTCHIGCGASISSYGYCSSSSCSATGQHYNETG